MWYEKWNATLFSYESNLDIESDKEVVTSLDFCKKDESNNCKLLRDILPNDQNLTYWEYMGLEINLNEDKWYKGN